MQYGATSGIQNLRILCSGIDGLTSGWLSVGEDLYGDWKNTVEKGGAYFVSGARIRKD